MGNRDRQRPARDPKTGFEAGAGLIAILMADGDPRRPSMASELSERGVCAEFHASAEATAEGGFWRRTRCLCLDDGLPGFERTLGELARAGRGQRRPVMVLTDTLDDDRLNAWRALGASGFFSTRPFSAASLAFAVRQLAEKLPGVAARHGHGAHLAAIAKTTRDAVIRIDGLERVVSWNPAATNLFGYSEAEARGRSIADLIVPDSEREKQRQLHANAVEKRNTADFEGVRRSKDHALIPVHIVSTPIVGRRGVEGVSLLIRDLREQLKLSGALSASEAFNRSVLEASPDCTKVLTADGALRYMNLNGQCALGIDDFRKLEGQKWETLWPEESREAVNTALREAVAGAESRFTAYCPRPTGAARWWDVIVRPVLDDDGKCVAVVATSRDVSEQRAAQVELARRERQLRLALDAGQLGTFSYSFDADRVEWDDRARAMFEAGEARGADLFRLFDSLHADDRQRARAAFDRASTPSSDGRFYFEGRIDPGGATVRWLETRGVVQFEDGEAGRRPVFAHAVSRDCTIERLDAERRAVLGRELAHRVKNAFAVAQSIVNRSISNATTLEEAREAIIGRIGALSVSQASLSGDVTEGGRLEAVVKAMLELFGARATVKGPDILLTPKATETFGLVVHELATNAAKHGALSNERGSIDVVWSIDDSSSPPRFEFVWRERDGPSPAAVNRKGFGSTILTRVAAAEFQCRPRQSFHPEGMEYTFSAPLPALGRLGLNRDVKISLRSPRLRALFQVWAECERKDGTTLGALVAKNSWDPLAMALAEKDNDGNIAFISVRGPAEALSAGWFAPNGQPSEQFRNFYLACAESGEPCHEFARFDFGEGPSFSLERLALPLPKCKQDSVVVVGFVDFEGRADPGLEDDGRIVDLMEDD